MNPSSLNPKRPARLRTLPTNAPVASASPVTATLLPAQTIQPGSPQPFQVYLVPEPKPPPGPSLFKRRPVQVLLLLLVGYLVLYLRYGLPARSAFVELDGMPGLQAFVARPAYLAALDNGLIHVTLQNHSNDVISGTLVLRLEGNLALLPLPGQGLQTEIETLPPGAALTSAYEVTWADPGDATAWARGVGHVNVEFQQGTRRGQLKQPLAIGVAPLIGQQWLLNKLLLLPGALLLPWLLGRLKAWLGLA